MRSSSSNPALGALTHINCCGAPLLIIAVAAGALALADAAAIVGVVAAVVGAVALWSRRRASCAAPVTRIASPPAPGADPDRPQPARGASSGFRTVDPPEARATRQRMHVAAGAD